MGKNEISLLSLAEHWPSSFVARQEVERFTGGIVNSKTLANLDSQGQGPAGRIKIGRKVAYPVIAFISWLESRIVPL